MDEYPKLSNLILDGKQWQGGHQPSEDKKLELRLGPPGEFLRYKANYRPERFSCSEKTTDCERVLPSLRLSGSIQLSKPSFSAANASESKNSHKRAAPAPVVGWPPIRSFRRNLASSNTAKLASEELSNKTPEELGSNIKPESLKNDKLVKINMEGIPIGRKISLNAYNSYQQLSVAIDELFRGLLAVQSETLAPKNENETDEAEGNGVSIAETDKYTLVYEDNEGDRMLVGDVPWHMFVSTAKRLRVLKSSYLSTP